MTTANLIPDAVLADVIRAASETISRAVDAYYRDRYRHLQREERRIRLELKRRKNARPKWRNGRLNRSW